jgi:hypothetical protein
MAPTNIERLIQLADEVFDVKSDPDQLNVDQDVLQRLKKMHPSTVSEEIDQNGPVAWVLVIPTTTDLMNRFLTCNISEKELFEMTPLDAPYEALYLCSALVLEEYRRKGIAMRLVVSAIHAIRQVNPLKFLFSWPFTEGGNKTTEKIAERVGMPLLKRRENK